MQNPAGYGSKKESAGVLSGDTHCCSCGIFLFFSFLLMDKRPASLYLKKKEERRKKVGREKTNGPDAVGSDVGASKSGW